MLTDEQIDAIHPMVKDFASWKREFARAIEQEVKDAMCKSIKEEDDHCADGDYMLDSDDCIMVIRGEWIRPDYSCGEKK